MNTLSHELTRRARRAGGIWRETIRTNLIDGFCLSQEDIVNPSDIKKETLTRSVPF